MTLNPIKISFLLVARILSIILFAVTIFAGFGGYANPEMTSFPAIAVLIFPYLFIASFVVGLAWLVSRHWVIAVMAALTLVACWQPASKAVPLSWSKSAGEGAPTFTLLTYNIFNLQDQDYPDKPYERAFSYLISTDADVVCLQECRELPGKSLKKLADGKFVESQIDTLRRRYPVIISDPRSGNTLLSKLPAIAKSVPDDLKGYVDLYCLDVKGERIDLVNVHLASFNFNGDDCEVVTQINSLQTARKSVGELKGGLRAKMSDAFRARARMAGDLRKLLNTLRPNVIVCGDFNDVPVSWAYRKVAGEDMKDAYAETNFGYKNTYNAHRFYFHIDQILYRGGLRALSVRRDKPTNSDHYPQVAEFELTDMP